MKYTGYLLYIKKGLTASETIHNAFFDKSFKERE